MSKLIISNWKMNPSTVAEATALTKEADFSNSVIAPPFPFLEPVGAVIKKAGLAAQDVFTESSGAFTGAVSASQLKSLGVQYVIVGHSERRRLGDTDEIVARKLKAALEAGLIPILCVGESRAEHDAGKSKNIIREQLDTDLKLINPINSSTDQLIVAYEPVWAISTEPGAQADTPENAVAMINFIKETLSAVSHKLLVVSYIYGGSVTSANAEAFLKNGEIEGALVGGASLKKEEIKKIIAVAMRY